MYAIDLNVTQIVCTEFKIVCYKYLDYEECMELIGIFESKRRLELYTKIKEELSENTRDYLENHIHIIQNGIIHSGKFENYFNLFGKKILPII